MWQLCYQTVHKTKCEILGFGQIPLRGHWLANMLKLACSSLCWNAHLGQRPLRHCPPHQHPQMSLSSTLHLFPLAEYWLCGVERCHKEEQGCFSNSHSCLWLCQLLVPVALIWPWITAMVSYLGLCFQSYPSNLFCTEQLNSFLKGKIQSHFSPVSSPLVSYPLVFYSIENEI